MQCSNSCGCHKSCIKYVPIFASLSSDEMMEISEIASSHKYEKGETIYCAGDIGGTLFVLYTRSVKIFRLNEGGKEQVLRVVLPGEFIGELSLFSSLPLTDYAQALEESTMCVLQGESLKNLMAKYPSIAFKVMDELSRRLESAEHQIESISLTSVTARLAQTLLDLSNGKTEVILPMTKGDFASQLGMSQETLSRKLSQLQEEGVILLKGQRKIIIKNKNELMDISLE